MSDILQKDDCLKTCCNFLPSYSTSLPPLSARKSKTHISLLPRVVARKDGGGGEGEDVQESKLSNEDFRRILFKK